MPEIKHQFTKGKMNKDLDERLVPNGEYKDAMNIQVATSEGSDVGTVQNILGNKEIQLQQDVLSSKAKAVSCVSDEKNDTLYYLVWDQGANYIIGYTTNENKAFPVFVDKKNVLEFQPYTRITGINIIDDMLFWTDNYTEPKKINITRCKQGTINFNQHTKLINEGQGLVPGTASDIETKHITVIKKAPTTPLGLRLETTRDPNKTYTGVVTTTTAVSPGQPNLSSFRGNIVPTTGSANTTSRTDFTGISPADGENIFHIAITQATDGNTNNLLPLGPINSSTGLTGWHKPNPDYTSTSPPSLTNIPIGTKIVFKPFDDDGTPPGIPITDHVIKGIVEDRHPAGSVFQGANTGTTTITVRVLSVDGFPSTPSGTNTELLYAVDLFEEEEKLFEFKFPRFSYRYKYEDGEYSTFAPWTQVAFKPGAFDYHPRKGYNLGMTNRTKKVHLDGLIPSEIPKDVTSIDVLFKDEPSPNVYIVETIRPDDQEEFLAGVVSSNKWDHILNNVSAFTIEAEAINSVVPSNQLLRSWDNVPRRALAQDVTGSRIVYGNYVQNYDITVENQNYVPAIEKSLVEFPEFSYISEYDLVSDTWSVSQVNNYLSESGKSIKSLRDYQLGLVFVDKYGRETPVLSNTSGNIKVEKDKADKYNRFRVRADKGKNPDQDYLKYFKFYVKETSGEYYNMALDRWYNAEDGNIWLAFPSSDRNKIDIDTFLILKKGSDTSTLVSEPARYKTIAIENEAPDFIKTTRLLASQVTHDSTSANNDIFGTTLTDAPVIGEDEFKLKFNAYQGTAGQNLHEYRDGKLYIEFENISTKQASKRYRIVSISTDEDATGGATVAQITHFNIQLKETLSEDVNFITNDPTGANASFIKDGITVNIYKYEVENGPQFDGRFFVKIYSDDVFKTNIGKSFLEGLDYRIVSTKKIFHMKPDHRVRHTRNINNFLTDGNEIPAKDTIDWYNTTFQNWGYYAVNEFTSFALFFRRYTRIINYQPLQYINLIGYHPAGTLPALGNTGLASLEPDQPSFRGDPGNNNDPTNGHAVVTYSSDLANPTWMTDRNWKQEWGVETNKHDWIDSYSDSNLGYTHHFSVANGFPREDNSDLARKADQPQHTEVWFIDSGPYAGAVWPSGTAGNAVYPYDMDWNNMGRFEQVDDTTANGPIVGTPAGNMNNQLTSAQGYDGPEDGADVKPGVSTYGGGHTMRLSFGGIGGISGGSYTNSIEPGFYNIGNWNAASNAASNSLYDRLNSFVDNFSVNTKFRWKEDPTQTVYTIGAGTNVQNLLRHSTVKSTFKGNKPAGGMSMAELLSFNFTKTWNIKNITPVPSTSNWDPLMPGKITNGYQITIPAADPGVGTSEGSALDQDLKIFVSTLVGLATDPTPEATLMPGMALHKYTKDIAGGVSQPATCDLNTGGQEFLVVREIRYDGGTGIYTLFLGGYDSPLSKADHKIASDSDRFPTVATNYTFVQVGMNGYSPNSEFNINTMGTTGLVTTNHVGKIGAVGYNIEFIDYIEPEEVLSENPAIFETEPKEIKELDIYYEASAAIPINFDETTIYEAFPIGSVIEDRPFPGNISVITGYNGMDVIVDNVNNLSTTPPGPNYNIVRPDGLELNVTINNITGNKLTIDPFLWNGHHRLAWHNCYSFANGVESNRIRDNFNLPFIANGVKASTTLEYDYKEEHRKYGLIYSGLYNSVSGVNNLNQFIAGEKITKDINPIYGSIQKLHSRNSDLVTLCEDKVLKILANKDAIFNADGNTNLTATESVLGQTIPFSGEFGISTNPESFASENYRAYFSDKIRGKIMRLSMDGLTPISDVGMKDWFKDNLKISNLVIGSYDDKKDEYNITLGNKAISYRAKVIGSSKTLTGGPYTPGIDLILTSSIGQSIIVGDSIFGLGIPYNTKVISNTNLGGGNFRLKLSNIPDVSVLGNYFGYGQVGTNNVAWDIDIYINKVADTLENTITFREDSKGWVSFKSFKPENAISMANDYYTFNNGKMWMHHAEDVDRNTFYNNFNESSISVILNDDPSAIKAFNTLNYEGSQSKIKKFKSETLYLPFQPNANYDDQKIYNLYSKKGWYVDKVFTDKEDGDINEFIEKEGKWFNNINRIIDLKLTKADAADFTFQGIGQLQSSEVYEFDYPTASVFDDLVVEPAVIGEPGITIDTGIIGGLASTPEELGATLPPVGDTKQPPAEGVDIPTEDNTTTQTATTVIVPEKILGCMDPSATNYNPLANVDSGVCEYRAKRSIKPEQQETTQKREGDEERRY